VECVILGRETCGQLAWQVEDLGAEWRCSVATEAEQALRMMQDRPAGLAILTEVREGSALLAALRARPLLAPPYVMGMGVPAPDGRLPEFPLIPEEMRRRKVSGELPILCALRLGEVTALAQGLLHVLGVPPGLRAWDFLPDMAALTAVHPPLLTDLQHALYPLTARRHGRTAGAVERSLRLCVESTWSRGSLESLERFFGSSVDPDRGKPTNREFLCRVQERLTLAAGRLIR